MPSYKWLLSLLSLQVGNSASQVARSLLYLADPSEGSGRVFCSGSPMKYNDLLGDGGAFCCQLDTPECAYPARHVSTRGVVAMIRVMLTMIGSMWERYRCVLAH